MVDSATEPATRPGRDHRHDPMLKRRDGWIKDIDLSRAAENTLVGVILFFGRYPVTAFRILFRPHAMEADLIFNSSYKNSVQVTFTRPVTFLVVSGFIYLAFSMGATGTFLPVEYLLNQFQWLIDRMPKKVEQLTLPKVALFMVPFVLFVALYAVIARISFRALGGKMQFKEHLNICCYTVGVVAVLLVAQSMIEGPLWDLALGHNTRVVEALPLAAMGVGLYVVLAVIAFRYLDLSRRGAHLS